MIAIYIATSECPIENYRSLSGTPTEYHTTLIVTGTSRTALQNSKLRVNAKDEGSYSRKSQKNPEGLGFDLGTTHNLGKCTMQDPRPYQLW